MRPIGVRQQKQHEIFSLSGELTFLLVERRGKSVKTRSYKSGTGEKKNILGLI